ncbi:MAG: NADH-quinone oxidoreductase subunit NuoE [Dehalococcoidia bacterium]|jgi:NADH-quinone oxidoreductase subunit E
MKINASDIKKEISKYTDKKGILIPVLQDVQAKYGYIPNEAVSLIAKELSIYPIDIYGVLTFYAQFHLAPRGQHIITVCQGTACHVMGGKAILDYIAKLLDVTVGETTKDGVFTLDKVACLGCCGMAPVVMIDKDFYGGCTIQSVEKLLDKYRQAVAI